MSFVKTRGHAVATIGKITPADRVAPPAPVRLAIELRSPVEGQFQAFIDANRATTPLGIVQPNTFREQSLALCGAGPSLATASIAGTDHVFACNSALPYLLQRGVRVTGAVGIDQTPGLLREWSDPPDVPYYLASSCDPALVQHLQQYGRTIRFFHNAVGFEGELAHYKATWPCPMICAGRGFTVVSRFLAIAFYLGFERVDLYGADCAFTDGDVAHANGDHATEAYRNPLIMSGSHPPSTRVWRTRPDMLRDAVDLVRRVRELNGRLRLVGDTLPASLLGKDDAYLDQIARTLQPGEMPPDHAAPSAAA